MKSSPICPDVVVLMVTAMQETRTAIDVLRRGRLGLPGQAGLARTVADASAVVACPAPDAHATAAGHAVAEQQSHQQTLAIRRADEETIHRLVAASSCRDVETGARI